MKTTTPQLQETLPITSNGRQLLPHVPTRLVGCPRYGALMLENIIFSPSLTAGGASDWILNDVEVDGVSQLKKKDLPGSLFSTEGIVAKDKPAWSQLKFGGLDVIERDSICALTVTYVGSDPQGGAFFGAITGAPPPQRPTVLPIATKKKCLPCQTLAITAVLDRTLAVNKLEIGDASTSGGAADWIVNDICINGTSLFVTSGDVPGDLFSVRAIDSFVRFHPGTRIELTATYIGLNEEGCCFDARVLGTVVRDHLDQPPPDVRATIVAAGETQEVIGHCDWRAPYAPPT